MLAGVVGINPARVEFGPGQQSREVPEPVHQPPDGVIGQGRVELAAAGLPPAKVGMVMGAVMAAWNALHRFEQVPPPHRLVDDDGLGRVDRAGEGRPVNQAHLHPDPSLGALLAGFRVRIEKVNVAGDDANTLEGPGVEHVVRLLAADLCRARRGNTGACAFW